MESQKEKNKERLAKHIEVLNKSYDNIVEVMEEEVDKTTDDKGNQTVSLKDDKIKFYADGVKKCAETLNYLFSEILEKEKELGVLNEKPNNEKPKEAIVVTTQSNLNDKLK